MCGLIGFSGKEGQTFNPYKIKLLFLYNEDRGEHASGFYTSIQNNIEKETGRTSKNLMKNKEIFPDSILIGHTRKQSNGWYNLDNVHPFKKEGIVLAHNGTISNIDDVVKEEELDKVDGKNDSRYILDLFVKYQKPRVVLPKLQGIANLLIYNEKKPGKLFVYKHPGRTLYCGSSDEGLYISSEDDALRAINCKEIAQFKDDHFYTIENGNILKNPAKIEMKEVKRHYMEYSGDWGEDYYGNDTSNSEVNTGSVKNTGSNFNIIKYNGGRLLKYIGKSSTVKSWASSREDLPNIKLSKLDIVTCADGLTSDDSIYISVYKDYREITDFYSTRTCLLARDLFIPNELAEVGDVVRIVQDHGADCFIGKKKDAGYVTLKKNEVLLIVQVYANTQDKAAQITNRRDLKLDGFLAVRLEDVKTWNEDKKFFPSYHFTNEAHCWILDKIDVDIAMDVSNLTKQQVENFLSVAEGDVVEIESNHKWVADDAELAKKNDKINDSDDENESKSPIKLAKGEFVQHYDTRILYEVEKDYTQKMFVDGIKVQCFDWQLLQTQFFRLTELIRYTEPVKKVDMVVKKNEEPTEEELSEVVNDDNKRKLSNEEKRQVMGDMDTFIEKIHNMYRLVDEMDSGALKTQMSKAVDALKEEFIAFNYDYVDQTCTIEDYTEYVNITLTSLDYEFKNND
jgi:hypothetical protein